MGEEKEMARPAVQPLSRTTFSGRYQHKRNRLLLFLTNVWRCFVRWTFGLLVWSGAMTRPVLDFSERKRQQQRQQRRPTGNTKKRIKYALSGAKDQMNSGGDGNGDDDDRKSDDLFTLMFLYCLILA